MTAPLDRRAFVGAAAGCGAWVLASLAGASLPVRRLFAAVPRGVTERAEPWGRLERVADGVWMLISTPLGADHETAMRTFSNGGLIAGRDGVLAVEGFASDQGSGWLSDEALRLTGRRPTHVVLTHYHGDHAAGLGGYRASGATARIFGTEITRDLLHRKHPESVVPEDIDPARSRDRDRPRRPRGPDYPARGAHGERPHDRDGGPAGRLVRRSGLDRPVPELRGRHAQPADRAREEAAGGAGDALGPGSWLGGPRSRAAGFLALLESVEDGARRAIAPRCAGRGGGARAGSRRRALGEWVRFSDDYYEVAFRAWERELRS